MAHLLSHISGVGTHTESEKPTIPPSLPPPSVPGLFTTGRIKTCDILLGWRTQTQERMKRSEGEGAGEACVAGMEEENTHLERLDLEDLAFALEITPMGGGGGREGGKEEKRGRDRDCELRWRKARWEGRKSQELTKQAYCNCESPSASTPTL